jgi:hypothetical protein
MTFEKGYNAFSLPLKPFEDISASKMLSTNAFADEKDTLFRYDSQIQQWIGYAKNMPSFNDDFIFIIDESYMIYVAENEVSFTFTGTTGTSIRYIGGVGDDIGFRGGLSARMVNDDVELSWQQVAGASEYSIYRAQERFGSGSLTDYDLIPFGVVANTTITWIDEDVSVGEYYYMVVARSEGNDQSGTYAVGVAVYQLTRGYSSFAFVLDPRPSTSVGLFANNELSLDKDTIYYYDRNSADWQGHPKLLPENINTGNVVRGSGYLVFTSGESTKVAVIGM